MVTAKQDAPLKHVEFVAVGPGKALVIMVSEDGQVENRVIDTPAGPAGIGPGGGVQLSQCPAGRAHHRYGAGRNPGGAGKRTRRRWIPSPPRSWPRAWRLWPGPGGGIDDKVLIVRGASHLLDSVEAQADIERIRTLFDDIERKDDLIRLLELAKDGDGVRIFIGSENRLFSLSGSSIVAAPYANAAGKIVGVIGVLGPTRLNYGRIIPDGGPYRQSHWTIAWLAFKETAMSEETEQEMPEARIADAKIRIAAEFAVLEALKAEIEILKDQRLRALAEAENVRRRAEREKTEASQYAVTKFARDMVGIADNFSRALAACPPELREAADPQIKAVLDGVEATDRQLMATLERYGVKPVDHRRRQIRSQSASGDRRSAGQRQAARHHRRCGAGRLT